ncbi:hypothetical protein G6F61_014886 [Rhizopus arrhizus]|nr:hypothetical protein G6F61_014886 [Rhizopus arrhizus]
MKSDGTLALDGTPGALSGTYGADKANLKLPAPNTLVMQLVEQGKVDLDAPASRYVPDLPSAWQAISVRDYLNHTRATAAWHPPLPPL